jgi:hypothetical protein
MTLALAQAGGRRLLSQTMRFDFRKAIAWASAVTLIFWCSCERHHVGELPGEVKAERKTPAEEHSSPSDQSTATTNTSHTSQTAAPRNSPANFFPDKPKP